MLLTGEGRSSASADAVGAQIIDGQPRLTTLTVLFAILRDLAVRGQLKDGEMKGLPGRLIDVQG